MDITNQTFVCVVCDDSVFRRSHLHIKRSTMSSNSITRAAATSHTYMILYIYDSGVYLNGFSTQAHTWFGSVCYCVEM